MAGGEVGFGAWAVWMLYGKGTLLCMLRRSRRAAFFPVDAMSEERLEDAPVVGPIGTRLPPGGNTLRTAMGQVAQDDPKDSSRASHVLAHPRDIPFSLSKSTITIFPCTALYQVPIHE